MLYDKSMNIHFQVKPMEDRFSQAIGDRNLIICDKWLVRGDSVLRFCDKWLLTFFLAVTLDITN